MKIENHQKRNNFHLAGIIPVEIQPLDFDMPWSDALMHIGKDYLAVERAVYECAYAGCETIWLVCSKETTPIIRQRLGDWILDPTLTSKTILNARTPEEKFKQIPIFYVPIHPRDKLRRVGIAWSILYGYNRAYKISKMFSRWATPSKFYVAFPHGIYSSKQIQVYRPLISSPTSIFCKSPSGLTAKDNELLAFTFDTPEYSLMKQAYKENEKLQWINTSWKDGVFKGDHLPRSQQNTGRFVTLATLVKYLNPPEDSKLPIKWYYNISSWEKYCLFLGSEEIKTMRKPKETLKYHEFNPIGADVEDYEEIDEFVEDIDNAENL